MATIAESRSREQFVKTSHTAVNAARPALVIARKEISDAMRNRLFIVSLVMLIGLSLAAIGLGAVTVHKQVAEYQQSVQILKELGKTNVPPMPTMNPLAVSKNFINYLAMIGALLAIILGFSTVRKERQAGTLHLILSRPVFRDHLLTGQFLGNAGLLGVLMLGVGIVTGLTLVLMGGVHLTPGDVVKLALTMGMSWPYLLVFLLLSMFFQPTLA
jgi:ABC-2 type transport system permease protein